MKTKQDNDVTESIGVIYVKNNIELSWPTGSGADYDENQIRQLHDQLYRCGLRQKKKLSSCDQSNRDRSMTKTKQNNEVTDHISLVYAEIDIELLGPIWSSTIYDKNWTGQWLDLLWMYDLRWK